MTKTKEKPLTTEEVLDRMLKENTGRSILDSGDAYGRSWERNQGREFENEPEVTLSFEFDYIDVTLNLYHWLKSRLDYDPKTQRDFEHFASSEKFADAHWLNCMRAFTEDRAKKEIWTGLHGDSETGPLVYTYNDENLLSQDIQFIYYEKREYGHRDSCGVLLQVHGGCDARGGLTKPKAFTLPTYSPECIFDYARTSIYADVPRSNENQEKFEFANREDPPYWDTDDGCHWYNQDHKEWGNLEDFEFSKDPADCGKGKIYVDGDSNGYCPITGAKLVPAMWPCG